LTSIINEIPTLEIKIGFPLPASSSCVGIRQPHKRCYHFVKGDIEYWARYGVDYLLRGVGGGT
jgi:hypothetical protein